MKKLSVLAKLDLPTIKPDQAYQITLHDRHFHFTHLKQVLGTADISKAGDRNAHLSATDEVMREAARAILSDLTLQHIYDRPFTNQHGEIDSVMRVNYDINRVVFAEIAHYTLGELKDVLLASTGSRIAEIGAALTGIMVAALTKLLDTHELIYLAKKLKGITITKARTSIGFTGSLSSRLQPNHPTDDLNVIRFLVYTGLSMGAGDAIIGLNPAIDTVSNISTCLHHLNNLRNETGAPTQICVLSHIKTQLACLKEGAPVEILFQSLAGTESTLTDEFDVTVDLLDAAYNTMQQNGALNSTNGKASAENFMYFETGQGSEYSYGKHEGMDMTTTEALCYGLARRYSPFMVNNVTGFIGPETHVDNHEMIFSNLQDHFMGKLMGLPMGMAPCYTLHSQITIEGQQMATQLLTAAGANFFMDVHLGTDRMLAYFDTSGHDDQTLREIHHLTPAPEFLAWALQRGIFTKDTDGNVTRGKHWGNPAIFCDNEATLQQLKEAVPAYYGDQHAGSRPSNAMSRTLKKNQAIGREAIYADLDLKTFENIDFRILQTQALNKHTHLNNPELGAKVAPHDLENLSAEYNDIQIIISDGLSAEAIHHNVPELLPVLMDGLHSRQLKIGKPIVATLGRVKLAESVNEKLKTQLTILLIGERPGGDALASQSLSAYFAYKLDHTIQQYAAQFSGNNNIRYEYSVISNIYSGGLQPLEAGSVIAEKAWDILHFKAAGNRLESMI